MLGGSALARAPKVGTQTPYWHRFNLGSAEVTVVSDGPLPLGPPKGTFVGVPDEEVRKMLSDNFLSPDNVVLEQNSPIVNTGDKLILFDTGMGISNIQAVVAGLPKLPVTVVNSHTHNDHVGDNWRFNDVYGMDTDFTRANARGSKEDAQAELAPDEICGALPAGFDAKAYATKAFHISHWLHDGDRIDLGGRTLKVIGTPGHTPDEIALLEEKNGLLFTGDTFYLGPIYLYRPETDMDAYVVSVQKLAAIAPHLQLLLPAHNTPVADPGYLPKVVTAIQEVRRGEVKPVAKDGKHEYVFEGFSFLMP